MTSKRKVIIISAALALSLLWIHQFTSKPSASAQSSPESILCVPVQVATFVDRIHVQCEEGIGNIIFFAAQTGNQLADQYLTLILTAFNSEKRLFVYFDLSDTSGAAYGCQVSDCRAILGIILEN